MDFQTSNVTGAEASLQQVNRMQDDHGSSSFDEYKVLADLFPGVSYSYDEEKMQDVEAEAECTCIHGQVENNLQENLFEFGELLKAWSKTVEEPNTMKSTVKDSVDRNETTARDDMLIGEDSNTSTISTSGDYIHSEDSNNADVSKFTMDNTEAVAHCDFTGTPAIKTVDDVFFVDFCNKSKDSQLPAGTFVRTHRNIIPINKAENVFRHLINFNNPCLIHGSVNWDNILELFSLTTESVELTKNTETPTLSCTRLILNSVEYIENLSKDVEHLKITITNLTDTLLHKIVTKAPRLVSLEITDASMLSAQSLQHVSSSLRELQHLIIYHYFRMTNKGIRYLGRSNMKLKTLCIIGDKVNAKTFHRIVRNHRELLCAFCNVIE
ncbi:uncharacterized protein LOC120849751 [Ixodes scapularis]|uniref:uncharacterized protein LOC120849751 n=1 Tax=Ixodes scapularis TaxID=6945 RepID=UPI001A9EAFE6|nr:uncharacterized protein LOC120849751 [Ixodes scapularis]